MPAPAPCPVAALMLAAGYSRRFGADKRRATLADGRSLLAASLALPCAALAEVWQKLAELLGNRAAVAAPVAATTTVRPPSTPAAGPAVASWSCAQAA